MPHTNHFAARLPRYLGIGILVVAAAFATIVIFVFALGELAVARFWEPLATRFGVFGSSIPFALTAFASGFAVGAGLGLMLGNRSSRITQLTALLVAITWLSNSITFLDGSRPPWSSVLAASALGAGLLIGGICTRHVRHA